MRTAVGNNKYLQRYFYLPQTYSSSKRVSLSDSPQSAGLCACSWNLGTTLAFTTKKLHGFAICKNYLMKVHGQHHACAERSCYSSSVSHICKNISHFTEPPSHWCDGWGTSPLPCVLTQSRMSGTALAFITTIVWRLGHLQELLCES